MIRAHFDTPDQDEVRVYGVYQYSWGQQLEVTGLETLNLPNHTEVQYEIEGEGAAITRVATVANGVLTVDVPFKCLQFAKQIKAYIYTVNDDGKGGQTIKAVIFKPRGRAKPDDDVTPDEERVVDRMVATLNAATKQANVDVKTAKESAQTATTAQEAAAASQEAAAASEKAAAASQEAAAASEKTTTEKAASVADMYNNLTIVIDGGDAIHYDVHIIDGGTATSVEGKMEE